MSTATTPWSTRALLLLLLLLQPVRVSAVHALSKAAVSASVHQSVSDSDQKRPKRERKTHGPKHGLEDAGGTANSKAATLAEPRTVSPGSGVTPSSVAAAVAANLPDEVQSVAIPALDLPGADPTPAPAAALTPVEVANYENPYPKGEDTASSSNEASEVYNFSADNATAKKQLEKSGAAGHRSTFICARQVPSILNTSELPSSSPYMCSCHGYMKYGHVASSNWSRWFKVSGSAACGLPQISFGDPAPGAQKACACFERLGGLEGASGLFSGPWWCIVLVAVVIFLAAACEGHVQSIRKASGTWPDAPLSPEGGLYSGVALETLSYVARLGPMLAVLLLIGMQHPENLDWGSRLRYNTSLSTEMGLVAFAFMAQVLLCLARDVKRLSQQDPGTLFDTYDQNRDGFIDRMEFARLMRSGKVQLDGNPLTLAAYFSFLVLAAGIVFLFVHIAWVRTETLPAGVSTLDGQPSSFPPGSAIGLGLAAADLTLCLILAGMRCSRSSITVLRAIFRDAINCMHGNAALVSALCIAIQASSDAMGVPLDFETRIRMYIALFMVLVQPFAIILSATINGADLKPVINQQGQEELVLVSRGETTRVWVHILRWFATGLLFVSLIDLNKLLWSMPDRRINGGADAFYEIMFLAPSRLVVVLAALYMLAYPVAWLRERFTPLERSVEERAENGERRKAARVEIDTGASWFRMLTDFLPVGFIVLAFIALFGDQVFGLRFHINFGGFFAHVLDFFVHMLNLLLYFIINFGHYAIALLLAYWFADKDRPAVKYAPELIPASRLYGAASGWVGWIPFTLVFLLGWVLVRPSDEPEEFLR